MVIDTLELKIIVDNKGTTARINNTTNALKNLHKVISDINGAGGVDGAVNGGGGSGSSSRGGSSRSSGSKSASSLMKNLNFGSMIAKLYFVRNITKQLGQNLAKVVQYGIDYEETLNLWQTAMRGNISQARVFTSEMTKAYGISSATLMNYQATFKNMLSALGNISETTAYGLSEALTQMALDFSSLYNVSVESAMTKFQAVLSGQVRPIRTAGYDITEQTLFQLYQSIGGTKTVRQLNQTEKQLLRILAVYKQMERSGATGDLAKTITSSANQLRIMNEQIKEFSTWVGVAFNTMLEKSGILIEINAWLYAGVSLAKEFAVYMGYVEKDYGISWSDDIADASDEYDKFKGKLLGFDKFQVLQSGGTDDTDVEQVLLDSIKAYQGLLDSAGNPAFERSLEILKQIGLELDENGNIVSGFDTLVEKAKEFSKTLGGIVFTVGLLANPWLSVLGAIEYCYWTNEDFKNSVNESFGRIKENAKGVLPLFTSIFETLLPLAEEIAIFTLQISETLYPMLEDVIEPLVPAVGSISELVSSTLVYVSNILTLVRPLIPLISQILYLLSPILDIINAIFVLTEVFPSSLWNIYSIPLQLILVGCEGILKVVQTIVETLRALFTWDWDSLGGKLSNLWNNWNFVGTKVWEDDDFIKPNMFGAAGAVASIGSLFYKDESKPELVTYASSGDSNTMNMNRLEDAVARGTIRGTMATQSSEGQQITVNVSGRSLFSILVDEAKSNGYELVKVR